jgi:hypothetical protein
MEIDQITSLVSIFSFGQHIMAAANAAKIDEAAAAAKAGSAEEEDKKEAEKKDSSEDSDSESDTSSDSGHSSDDHYNVKEEDGGGTKLTRSVSTPDLCATSAVAVASAQASEAPPCVEVASL